MGQHFLVGMRQRVLQMHAGEFLDGRQEDSRLFMIEGVERSAAVGL